MATYFNNKEYPTNEKDRFISKEGLAIKGLKDLAWTYIKSMTKDNLEMNQQFLVDGLKNKHKDYINKYWRGVESSFIHVLTKYYRNYGSTSSQEGKSYHPITRKTLHGNLLIKDSVNKLTNKILLVIKEIVVSEGKSMRNYP
jgi:hypothetical protein